jgi:hypothetical protein
MYALNTQAAKEADQKGGSINETGKYAGTFTRAENVKSKGGTLGVEFSFRSDDGKSADYLTLWTKNAEGKELYGFKTLMAIMTCLKVKNIAPVMRSIEKYSHDAQAKQTVQAEVFPDLMNKPIGLLIQMEEYENKDKTATKWKPSIYAPFQKDGSFTASEILNKAVKAETMEKMLAALHDRPLRGKAAQAAPVTPAPSSFDDFDDDIPF